jgi:hypothetical protein
MSLIDVLGWCATAVFVGSYFFKHPHVLRRVQMVGAALWLAYGLLLGAPPVVGSNLLVLLAALLTAHRGRRPQSEQSGAL